MGLNFLTRYRQGFASALSFVVGMQVGGAQNSMNNQAGGPPGMSRSQDGQQGDPGGQLDGSVGQTGGAPPANISVFLLGRCFCAELINQNTIQGRSVI